MNTQPRLRVNPGGDYCLTQRQVRAFVRLMPGQSYHTFETMYKRIWDCRGTPQDRINWREPEKWILERLSGEVQRLAFHLWQGSEGLFNPRYWRGAVYLTKQYQLLKTDKVGTCHMTDTGQDFVANPQGVTVQRIDFCEGQLQLLQIILEHGPGRRADLLPAFTSFLHQYPRLQTASTIDTAWSDRTRDLVDRSLVERVSQTYRVTQAGQVYLGQATLRLLEEAH